VASANFANSRENGESCSRKAREGRKGAEIDRHATKEESAVHRHFVTFTGMTTTLVRIGPKIGGEGG
jgi:hypothetical protein